MNVHLLPRDGVTAPLHHIEPELARLLSAGSAPLDLSDPAAARGISAASAAQRNLSRPRHTRAAASQHDVSAIDGRRIRVRVYRPQRSTGSLPCVIHFHGGAFTVGNLDTEDRDCAEISLQADCVVVSVEYPLAPEHPFPAALQDGFDVLRWASAGSEALGIDGARLAVSGTSAGGCIAAGVALMARDRGGPELRVQLLTYPVLDDRLQTASSRWANTPVLTHNELEIMWANYRGAQTDTPPPPYFAPARHDDLTGLPAAYILIAGVDPLRDEGLEYGRRLLEAGGSVELHHYAGAVHGFDKVGDTALGRRAIADRNAALGGALRTVMTTDYCSR